MLRPLWIVHKCPAEKKRCRFFLETGMRSGVWVRISETFREFQQEKKMACWKHREPRTTPGQLVERPCWDVERLYWDVERLYRDMDSGITKKSEIVFVFFDGCLFWLLAVCLCPASMSKHEVGFAHTNEIACKKQSRLCRGWFTAYTYGLKGLSAYTGKSWTPIQGFHESLYWENCSPIPGKHPGIASKTPV